MSRRLVRNIVECARCHKLLESRSVHDFIMCGCETFNDGGLDYLRRGYDPAVGPPIDRCEYADE